MTRPSGGSHPGIWLVGLAFTVSGFTSLVLEIVWSKALALMLGSTLHSMSTVVAAYLAGLALGAFLAGRLAHRVTRPLRLYGILEMGVGLYALVSLFLIHALDPVTGALYSRLGPTSGVYLAARVGLAAIVLLPPTVMMGATLPALVAWAGREGSGFGKSLGRLYGLNTLGAVAGSAFAGAFLVPQLGLLATTRVVGVLALLVGGWMVALGSRAPAVAKTAPPAAEPKPVEAAAHGSSSTLAAILFGASGAMALVFEITWARVFGLVYGSSVYSFAIVLATYLLAIALGSLLWGGRLADSGRPWRAFAFLQVAVSAGAALGLWLLPELPKLFLSTLFAQRQNLFVLYLLLAAIASLVTFLPCLAFGALFPVGTRLIAGGKMGGARATGVAYAANTAGTLTGSLAAGFLLLPRYGVHATWVAASIVSLALGAVALFTSRREAAPAPAAPAKARELPAKAGSRRAQAQPARKSLPAPALAGATVALFASLALANLFAPAWSKALFTLGSYRTSVLLNSGVTTGAAAIENLESKEASNKILYYRESLHGIVSVHEAPSDTLGGRPMIALRMNGKPDASTAGDMATQVLCGHIPFFWAPPGAEVCLIGQGSGITTRSVLTHDVKHLTMVEIEPAIIEASHFFDAYTDTALSDPRLEVVLEDGRQHLQHSGHTYDVIVSEPSNPWVAGINNLFTVDFYRRVRAALRPHGVFAQWIQSYEISPLALGSLFRSVAQVFPDAEVFLINYDFILVARPPGEKISRAPLWVENESGPVADFLRRNRLGSNGSVAGCHVGSVRSLIEHFPEAPLNTDDRPFVEYRAPIDLYQPPAVVDPWDFAEARPMEALGRWVRSEDLDSVAYAAAIYHCREARWQRAHLLSAELRERGGADVAMANEIDALATRGMHVAEMATFVDEASKALEKGDFQTTQALLGRALALEPDHPGANLLAGRTSMRAGDLQSARKFLEVALKKAAPADRSTAYNNLGIIEMREGHAAKGRAAFESALDAAPHEPMAYVYLSRLEAEAGRPDSARALLERGLAAARVKQPIEDELAVLAGRPSP